MKNLVEILKGREGMKLYSPLCGECRLVSINNQSDFPINVVNNKGIQYSFTFFGQYSSSADDAECLLFPSKEERTWENYQSGRVARGEMYYVIDTRNDFNIRTYQDDRDPIDQKLFETGNYFLTRKEAEEFTKKIKRMFLEKYN